MGSSYQDPDMNQVTAVKSVKYNMTYPNQMYLMVNSTSYVSMAYNIYIWALG